jgi:flavodoxin
VLVLAACSGDDDDADGTTVDTGTDAATTAAPTTTAADTTTSTTAAPTTTAPELVTEGATVVVGNSSIVGGAAGRMTDELAGVGFTMGTPTNGTDRLETSIVYYTDDDGAAEVAESVGTVMGGLDVEAMPDPIPTESGTLDDGQVLVLLGTEQADQTIEELGGTTGEAGDEDADDETATTDEEADADSAVAVDAGGSVVVVANVSGVGGSAGAMTDELESAGFEVGAATNGTEDLETSVVYYTDAEGAEADADLVAETLGGLEVEQMPDPIPTESGELDGDVLVLLGTDLAGQSLSDITS